MLVHHESQLQTYGTYSLLNQLHCCFHLYLGGWGEGARGRGAGTQMSMICFVLFCFVMPICLFVAFESMSQTFPNILFSTKQGGQ